MIARVLAAACALVVLGAGPVAAQSAGPTRGFVSLNFGQQTKTPGFDHTISPAVHAENTAYDLSYEGKGGPMFEIGGAVRVWRRLAAGAAVSRANHVHSVTVTGGVPHPFVFNAPRPLTGTQGDVAHDEFGIHVQALWQVTVMQRLDVTLGGGPSWLGVKQQVASEVAVSETYPYDEVTFVNATVVERSVTAATFNVVGDVAFRLTRHLGVGVSIRHADKAVTLRAVDLSRGDIPIRAGGTLIGAGIRFHF